MNPSTLIDDLTRKGVHLSVKGDRLVVDAPKRMLTDEVIGVLRDHKPEILAALRATPPWEPSATCKGRLFWADAREPPDNARWRCDRCDPPPAGLWRHACALPPGGAT